MRRAHSILLILALLATPLALLARSDCNNSACDCMCDFVNRSVQSHAHSASKLCGQAATSIHQCAMKTPHHSLDYGLNALMAPTAPLPVAHLSAPAVSAPLFALQTPAAPSGFLAAPSQPPRG